MTTNVKGAICEGRKVPAVTIFGWDDVLCPTTHAQMERAKRAAHALGVPSAEARDHRRELVRVGASVIRCVQAAQRHGPVVIVTESNEDWVRGSAELLLPGAPAECLRNVEVVSSKARFGKQFPGKPECWRIAAFSYVTNSHLLPAGKQPGGGSGHDAHGALIAVSTASRARGDRSATGTLRLHHPRMVAKTVALMEGPSPRELRKQLDLLSDNLEWMFGYPRRVPRSPLKPPTIRKGVSGDHDEAATASTQGSSQGSVLEEEESDTSEMTDSGSDEDHSEAARSGEEKESCAKEVSPPSGE